MNPYKLHNAFETNALVLIVAFAAACGANVSDEGRDESFMAHMGSDGKADALLVTEQSPEAEAVLQVVNTLPFRDLKVGVGLDERAAANIVAHRDRDAANPNDDDQFDSLAELDATPWVGMRAFRQLYGFAEANGYIDRFRYPTSCAVDADCGEGICHIDHCYDVTAVTLPTDSITALEVAADGTWHARAHAEGKTVREMSGTDEVEDVETNSFDDPDITAWLPRLPDGSLTAVTRTCASVIPEFGEPLALSALNNAVAAAYSSDGTLFVAAEARDIHGTPQGLVIIRQEPEGWYEEFKYAFTGERSVGEQLAAGFTRAESGSLELWVDIDQTARRFDRAESGYWTEAVQVDMSDFGERAADRDVQFLQANDGTVFLHRQAWTFARTHDVVRVDGDSVTAVTALSTSTRSVAAHPNGNLTVVYADGSLGQFRDGEQMRGENAHLEVGAGALLRAHGDDLYYVRGDHLTILKAR